ncbi:hypothetical protein EIP91_005246 [Steccherinum ochraceum]|uniref:Uncharacterized protein n=1 Tax=Steccherinum ochraceum TaxID=92696 RepID=A0A4R0RQG0_9APHY|nr:hypothetical protein EIP91_005246 [Steccherinum ochraceum]
MRSITAFSAALVAFASTAALAAPLVVTAPSVYARSSVSSLVIRSDIEVLNARVMESGPNELEKRGPPRVPPIRTGPDSPPESSGSGIHIPESPGPKTTFDVPHPDGPGEIPGSPEPDTVDPRLIMRPSDS